MLGKSILQKVTWVDLATNPNSLLEPLVWHFYGSKHPIDDPIVEFRVMPVHQEPHLDFVFIQHQDRLQVFKANQRQKEMFGDQKHMILAVVD